MATNPYTKIDPRDFLIKRFGALNGVTVYLVDLAGHNPFDGCVFRDHLARFILNEFEGDSHLGNDDLYIRNLGNNLALAVREAADIIRLKANFRVL